MTAASIAHRHRTKFAVLSLNIDRLKMINDSFGLPVRDILLRDFAVRLKRCIRDEILQWLGCITGVAGSLLLALHTRHSGWGFVLFLVSNGFWAAFGIQANAPGLIAMQAIFTATSLIGIYCRLISRRQVLIKC